MRLAFNKRTALSILRHLRTGQSQSRIFARRCNVPVPDASPWKRWVKSTFLRLEADLPFALGSPPYSIAVPDAESRIRSTCCECTVYADGVPAGAFIDLGYGIAISSPELLFIELANDMDPVEHLMLGHELCGSFARDAKDPYNGLAAYNIQPLTSTAKIARFLASSKSIRGIDAARASLARLNDNAWSPTESLIASFLRLPIDCLGFDFGELELNPRIDLAQPLPGAKTKRYPDIMIAGTPVGINYDGLVHLDLNSIVKTAMRMGAQPGSAQTEVEVNRAVANVREKALDDIRRNRELAISGLSVLPVLKEDLYVPDGLELVAMGLVKQLEKLTDKDMSIQRLVLENNVLSKVRYRTLLSLMPGKHERNLHICQRIGDLHLYECADEPGTSECWIEL